MHLGSRQSSRPAVDIASDTGIHGADSAPVEEHGADEISAENADGISAENAALIRQLNMQDYTLHLRPRQSSRPAAVIASDTVPHGEDSAPVEEHSEDEISAKMQR